MFSPDDLEKFKLLLNEVGFNGKREQADEGNQGCRNKKSKKNSGNRDQNQTDNDGQGCISLNPTQLLIIAGLLTGVLDVEAVQISRDQSIDIVLTGTLKRKTQLDMIMSQIGKLPLDQVIKMISDSSS